MGAPGPGFKAGAIARACPPPQMLARMLIDSHCHLNFPGLVEDEAGVLARARAEGVGAFINISTRRAEWDAVVAAAERHSDVWASIGIHPHEADGHPDLSAEDLVRRSAHPRVVGIGETGLDFFYDRSGRMRQEESFRTHCAAARATGLPLIVHSRAAEEETVRILEEELGRGAFPVLFHCFTGSAWLAERALGLGAFLSFSGIVTFRNASALQSVARAVPADRLLVETDAPFLAPVPVRGRTCEPAFVAHTLRFLASLRSEAESDVAAMTSRNALRLFSKMAG